MMLALETIALVQFGFITSGHIPMLLAAVGTGLVGGVTSGLLGTSPGGAIVVLSTLLLGADQHLAQGISLAVQVPPTGVSGILRYRAEGHRCSGRWLAWLAAGMIVGGTVGAIVAAHAPGSILRWSYVGYLIVLDLLLITRSGRVRVTDNTEQPIAAIAVWPLLSVGLAAGLSSGFLGIGGGLAIVAGLSGCLKMPQHQSQMISLILTTMPTTLGSAYVYWRAGQLPSWSLLLAVIVGLWGGTDFGARLANRLDRTVLRRVLVGTVTAMVIYMAWRALVPHPSIV
jgi:uncharacterized protein